MITKGSMAPSTISRLDDRQSVGGLHALYAILGRYSLVVILALLIAGFSLARPESFFTINNFQGIFINQIVVVFAAIGLIGPLIDGELDLSVGYVVGLSQALVVGLMTLQGLPMPLAIVITIVACAIVGLINGALVVKIGLNSLIVTLATGNVIYGLVLWYTAGTILFQGIPREFLKISSGSFLYVPLPIWYAVLLIVIVEFVLGYLPVGRRMYAVGGNRRAALLTGIAVDWIVIAAFAMSGVVCGLGGIIIASRLGSAQPELGPSFLLPAFASAFLGATTIRPGRFNAIGTVVAVYVIAVIVTGLQQIGVPFWAEYVVYGVALAGGVALSTHLTRLREERARRDQLRAFEESREMTSEISTL
jgi:ribose transport system permease protein